MLAAAGGVGAVLLAQRGRPSAGEGFALPLTSRSVGRSRCDNRVMGFTLLIVVRDGRVRGHGAGARDAANEPDRRLKSGARGSSGAVHQRAAWRSGRRADRGVAWSSSSAPRCSRAAPSNASRINLGYRTDHIAHGVGAAGHSGLRLASRQDISARRGPARGSCQAFEASRWRATRRRLQQRHRIRAARGEPGQDSGERNRLLQQHRDARILRPRSALRSSRAAGSMRTTTSMRPR